MPSFKRRVLAALYHSYIDTSSGAAISLRDMLEALARRDWQVRVFCGPGLDFETGASNRQLLEDQGIPFEIYDGHARGEDYSLYMFRKNNVDCGLYLPSRPGREPARAAGENFLQSYEELLDSWRPEVVVTYGGSWLAGPLLRMARQRGVRTVFYLCSLWRAAAHRTGWSLPTRPWPAPGTCSGWATRPTRGTTTARAAWSSCRRSGRNRSDGLPPRP